MSYSICPLNTAADTEVVQSRYGKLYQLFGDRHSYTQGSFLIVFNFRITAA